MPPFEKVSHIFKKAQMIHPFIISHLPSFLFYFFFFSGIFFLGLHLKYIFGFIYRKHIRPRKNFIERYGKNTWVLVTGASDGIGKAFCEEFARIGFNVCLLARNMEKLKNVEEIVQKINPNIKTKIVVVDLSKTFDDNLISYIAEETKDLDISMLVNNAGIAIFKEIFNMSAQEVKEILVTNAYSLTILTKMFIPRMATRSKRSAIINVSSVAGLTTMRYLSTYCGTKGYVDQFTRTIEYELRNNSNYKIDFLALRPCYVSTKIVNNRPLSFFTIKPSDCVSGCLDDLGYEITSGGHWRHQMEQWYRIKFQKPLDCDDIKEGVNNPPEKKSN